ncbi:hypothetical protein SCP_0603200 [Sparassis crispa]|uniref:Uncharacterized protein n=1 Tax=Sparassis crispa TaxID=139825 RepID=A0A401GQ64_9APHY|nr:hypothetical protein SCP_0603200 [Sparassis crispa]GBE84342.1 hypothetical protein SCP_0603200 [Sparassis crispa]
MSIEDEPAVPPSDLMDIDWVPPSSASITVDDSSVGPARAQTPMEILNDADTDDDMYADPAPRVHDVISPPFANHLNSPPSGRAIDTSALRSSLQHTALPPANLMASHIPPAASFDSSQAQ